MDEKIQLGPRAQVTWVKGSSGGAKASDSGKMMLINSPRPQQVPNITSFYFHIFKTTNSSKCNMEAEHLSPKTVILILMLPKFDL